MGGSSAKSRIAGKTNQEVVRREFSCTPSGKSDWANATSILNSAFILQSIKLTNDLYTYTHVNNSYPALHKLSIYMICSWLARYLDPGSTPLFVVLTGMTQTDLWQKQAKPVPFSIVYKVHKNWPQWHSLLFSLRLQPLLLPLHLYSYKVEKSGDSYFISSLLAWINNRTTNAAAVLVLVHKFWTILQRLSIFGSCSVMTLPSASSSTWIIRNRLHQYIL